MKEIISEGDNLGIEFMCEIKKGILIVKIIVNLLGRFIFNICSR